MNIKLLTEHHFEFLSLKGSCTGLSESTLVKMPHCWQSHVAVHLVKSLTFWAVVHTCEHLMQVLTKVRMFLPSAVTL